MNNQEIIERLNNAWEWIDAVADNSEEREDHIVDMLDAIQQAIEILSEQ